MANKQPTETDNKQMTIEEYLVSQLETKVILKDGTYLTDPSDGHVLTKQEAIATNILNLAMKGDMNAVKYINNLQLRLKMEQEIENKKQRRK